jgi:hypothetical protein
MKRGHRLLVVFLAITTPAPLSSCRCGPERGPHGIEFRNAEGLPTSVDGREPGSTRLIEIDEPVEISFRIPSTRDEPVIERLESGAAYIRVPKTDLPGGSYTIYHAEGKRIDVLDILEVLAVTESHLGQENGYVRRLVLEEKEMIEACRGKTAQGFDYAFYELLTAPSSYLIGFSLPSGTLVIDGGGYVGFRTIPTSLQVVE